MADTPEEIFGQKLVCRDMPTLSTPTKVSDEESVLGGFTLAGLLYEGSDFKKWLQRLCMFLRAHGIDPRSHWQYTWNDQPFDCVDFLFAGFHGEVSNAILRVLISPHIARRVPDLRDTEGTQRPMQLLQKLSQPFRRLFDLPPELRNRIYEEYFDDYLLSEYTVHAEFKFTVYTDHGDEGVIKRNSTPVPAILQASKQLRHEVTPIFFSRCHFKLSVYDTGVDTTAKISRILQNWITKGAHQQDVKHLRLVDLDIEPEDPHGHWRPFRLCWSTDRDLTIEGPANLDDKSELLLRNHNETIKRQIQSLNLKGEAIILTITMTKDLWTPGTLEYINDDEDDD